MTVFVYHVDSTNFNFYLSKCTLLHLNTGIPDVIGDFLMLYSNTLDLKLN